MLLNWNRIVIIITSWINGDTDIIASENRNLKCIIIEHYHFKIGSEEQLLLWLKTVVPGVTVRVIGKTRLSCLHLVMRTTARPPEV